MQHFAVQISSDEFSDQAYIRFLGFWPAYKFLSISINRTICEGTPERGNSKKIVASKTENSFSTFFFNLLSSLQKH